MLLRGFMPIHLMGCTDLGKWADEFVRSVEETPSIATDHALMYEWFSLVFYAGYDNKVSRSRSFCQSMSDQSVGDRG